MSAKSSSSSPILTAEAPEDLAVRECLAQRLDRRLVERHVDAAPRRHQVEVLELGRRRQHDVRVRSGVGEELLDHDREQVVAPQPIEHAALVGRDRRGVGVVDDQRPHRRLELRERATELHHAHLARGRVLEVGPRRPAPG